jgi:DNA-binding NtrC family response regulator
MSTFDDFYVLIQHTKPNNQSEMHSFLICRLKKLSSPLTSVAVEVYKVHPCQKLYKMDNSNQRLVGISPVVREIEEEIECAARSDAKVLITGESGVGKEVVARLVHQRSRRSAGPLVTINCAGVPDSLLESELFGHMRGSFTDAHRDKMGWLEQAQGGTIFMDEIGEMSLRMQALLLRFLENGEIQRVGSSRVQSVVNVRVISATNRNLSARIAEKSFREDLYYRLNVIHVAIPPLRERREDVPCLFKHFIRWCSAQHRIEEPQVSEEALIRLTSYDWPGNVRELKNVAERVVIRMRPGTTIASADLPKEICFGPSVQPMPQTPAPLRPTPEMLYKRMTVDGESFWSVVYQPFMSRDLTRHDLREVISRGLDQTRGSYKTLVQIFNLPPDDYKRLLNFLRKYDCHMPFQQFRSAPVRLDSPRRPQEGLVAARP